MTANNFARMSTILLIFLVLCLLPSYEGKYIEGHFETEKDFQFVDRFCFQPNERGRLEYDIKYPATLLFSDDNSQWPYIRKVGESMTCKEKQERIPKTTRGAMFLEDGRYGCQLETEEIYGDTVQNIHCKGHAELLSNRERWWYIVLSNCDFDSGIHAHYNMTMTNGDSLWDKHFSADERYIWETDLVFLILYMIMLSVVGYYSRELIARRMFHLTYKLFVGSVIAEWLSLGLKLAGYIKYAVTGVAVPGLQIFADLDSAVGIMLFVLMIMLLGKGFTVSRKTLKPHNFVGICLFMAVFGIAYIALYAYDELLFDPRDVLYKYESPAGYGIVALNVIGFLIFFSVEQVTRKKVHFYVSFGVIISIWWLATPMTIFVCNYALDPWLRAKVVNGMERAVMFYGHFIFLILSRPSASNKTFPFHFKTSQVGVLREDTCEAYCVQSSSGIDIESASTSVRSIAFTDLFVTDHSHSANKNTAWSETNDKPIASATETNEMDN
ncbi:transmembrane protein 145-like [Glandiceps talaboti]